MEEICNMEKILNQSITELGLSNVKRYRDAGESTTAVESSKGVNALASLKRWAKLVNHCERRATKMVKIDGLFKGDLARLNSFLDVMIRLFACQMKLYPCTCDRCGYTEAANADTRIKTHMSKSKHKGSWDNLPMVWLANEKDKLHRTMSWKEKGSTLFCNGD